MNNRPQAGTAPSGNGKVRRRATPPAFRSVLRERIEPGRRPSFADRLGGRYFFGIFSLLSILGLVWLVVAYRAAPLVLLWPTIPALGWVAFAFVFLGFLLIVVGSGPMNPTDTRGPRVIDSKLPAYAKGVDIERRLGKALVAPAAGLQLDGLGK